MSTNAKLDHAAASAAAPAAEAPKPMPFAIMRNTHEALRASIRLQQGYLDAGDRPAFVLEWRDFQRALAVHMAMEDESMFALLDEVGGGAITAAALPAEHAEDKRLAAAVDATLGGAPAAADLAAVRAAWQAWRDDHLHHLEHEEAVMMPLTMKTAPTPHERARIVNERLVTPFERHADFAWFVGWVVGLLSRHGSAAQPSNVATRVFAWGLQHACTREQWQRLRPVVRQAATPAIWAELAQQFGLDGDGPL
jgi:hypothetical protein